VPIIAVALMLMSQRARLNGPVFVIGWLIGLAVIGPAQRGHHGCYLHDHRGQADR
jgi:hypothetical protein